jgi:hypothetical protein
MCCTCDGMPCATVPSIKKQQHPTFTVPLCICQWPSAGAQFTHDMRAFFGMQECMLCGNIAAAHTFYMLPSWHAPCCKQI